MLLEKEFPLLSCVVFVSRHEKCIVVPFRSSTRTSPNWHFNASFRERFPRLGSFHGEAKNMSNGRRNNSNNFLGSDFPGNFSIFGNRTSIFEDFFGHDPFDDPFFREPFGSFFGSSQFPSMLNSSQSIFGRTNGFGAHPQLLSEMLPATNQQVCGTSHDKFKYN